MLNLNQFKIITYNCPCCGNEPAETIEKTGQGFSLDICSFCGFIYRKKYLDFESWINWARNHHRNQVNSSYYQRFQIKWSQFKNYIPEEFFRKKIRHLDIGASIGPSTSDDWEFVGIETSKLHANFHREYFKKDIRNEVMIKDGSFDLITCFRSLAYFPNLSEFIVNIREKLTPTGKFIIAQPVFDLPDFNDISRLFSETEYFCFFSSDTLENILTTNGFNIEVVDDKTFKEVFYVCSKADKSEPAKKLLSETKKEIEKFKLCNSLLMKRDFEGIKKTNPNVVDAYLAPARPDDRDQCDGLISETMRLFPNFIPVLLTAANFFHSWKRLDESLNLMVEIEKKMISVESIMALAHLYYDMGIFKSAAEKFDFAAKIEGPPEVILKKIASCYNTI